MNNIDWGAYFDEFSRSHGGNPVLVGFDENNQIISQNGVGKARGYLLFPDGWMYNAANIRGPEYKPPNKKVQVRLIRAYHKTRMIILTQERNKLRDDIESLMRAQQLYSTSLQVPVSYISEDENGKRRRVREVGPIDFKGMLSKLRDLTGQIRECQIRMQKADTDSCPEVTTSVLEGFSPASIMATLEEIDEQYRNVLKDKGDERPRQGAQVR